MNVGHKKRKLTRFLCREMLFDYSQNSLDESRRQGVEEFLKEDEDLQQDLEHLEAAIGYCKDLGKSELDKGFIKQISENKSCTAQVADRLAWRNLPEYVKWGIEAMTIAVSVAVFSKASMAFLGFLRWMSMMESSVLRYMFLTSSLSPGCGKPNMRQ